MGASREQATPDSAVGSFFRSWGIVALTDSMGLGHHTLSGFTLLPPPPAPASQAHLHKKKFKLCFREGKVRQPVKLCYSACFRKPRTWYMTLGHA